jgi:hypothetical protein
MWGSGIFCAAAAIGVFFIIAVALFGFSGISPQDRLEVLEFLPIAIVIGFAGIGVSYADFHKRGVAVFGWALALGASLCLAIVLNSHEIFPERHSEIIMAVVAVLLGIGLVKFFELRGATKRFRSQCAAFGVVLVLFGAMALTVYPSSKITGGGEQGLFTEDMEGIYWARDSIDLGSHGAIASENRLSSMLYGAGGLNATWYYAHDVYFATNFSNAAKEMRSLECPSGTRRIDYIFLDRSMIGNVVLEPWVPHRPIQGDALQKFDGSGYIRLFDNGYCVVYAANWGGA